MHGPFIDREVQRKILERLRNRYPSPVSQFQLSQIEGVRNLDSNVAYLNEHGLLKSEMKFSADGNCTPNWNTAVLTARGVDFLEDDGGLTAILGKITVRLDAESVRELLAQKVESETSLPAEQKSSLLAAIRKLPETMLQDAAKRLMAEGLAHAPHTIQLLQKLVGHVTW